MNEKPKANIKLYRPAFIVERENEKVALDEGMRTCVGYTTMGFDKEGKKIISDKVCSKELPRGLRYYCSGECMNNAKEKGDYRHD